MTETIFYESTDILEFQATVLNCRRAGDAYLLELDRTAFFPEQGGQYADRGTLTCPDKTVLEVLDVSINEGIILHRTAQAVAPGTIVYGSVDGADRFDKMQQHTGEHIVSGIIHRIHGLNNVGFHLGPDHVTMDYDGYLAPEELSQVEMLANEAVWQNLPVQILYPSDEELSSMSYRSKIEIEGRVRIVSIPGIDVCACCAPHTKTTGEIGLIRIADSERYKGGVRITLLCGRRALQADKFAWELASKASKHLSVKPEGVLRAIAHLQEVQQNLTVALNNTRRRLLDTRLNTLDPGSSPHLIFEDELDNRIMQNAVNTMMERFDGYCAVFSFSGSEEYRFVAGSRNLDCRELAAGLRTVLKAKGGGSARMIQGTIPAAEQEIKEYFMQMNA